MATFLNLVGSKLPDYIRRARMNEEKINIPQ
jgi:hypothetical protein